MDENHVCNRKYLRKKGWVIMSDKKIIIVGGVAGGATTGARLRRLNEENQIIILERGKYVSFANCGLPYYVGDVIKHREALELMTPKKFLDRFNIDVRVNNEALKVDRENKKILVKNHSKNEEYQLEYDYLVLSPGALPIKPNIKGIDDVNVFTLRTIPDSVNIKEYVEKNSVKKAVVVGGGFIGIEMAENLRHRGIEVTLVEMAEQVMPAFDMEIAQFMHQEIALNGVQLILGDGVDSFEKRYDTNVTITKSGKRIEADIIVLAIGVTPDSKLAKDCGLDVGKKGHIVVNENMRTSDPNIFAVGDAVQVKNYITSEIAAVPLAGPANKQGRIAAENIEGRETAFKGVMGTSIVKVFGLDAASVGLNEKTCVSLKLDFEKVYVHPNNHAGYYPDPSSLTIKLLFLKPSGKILGAQVVGGNGVDKRIDVMAAMINQKATVYDLEELELAYAPPFGSAKDPVNMAGYVASNVLRGDVNIVHWSEIEHVREQGGFVLDVRTAVEFGSGHISGAVNIPDMEIRKRLNEIPKDRPILTYCQVGFRGYLAARTLMQNGYKDVRNLTGGYKLYHIANIRVQDMAFHTEDHEVARMAANMGKPIDDTIHQASAVKDVTVDCTGLQCPGPIMKVAETMKSLPEGSKINVSATDPGFAVDLPAWARSTGNTVMSLSKEGKKFVAVMKKTSASAKPKAQSGAVASNDKAIILFSGDMDKALAAFIIANTSASMGRNVTVFVTFWGLNVLRKSEKTKGLKKTFVEKMFAKMMPRGARKTKLSQMNMMGMGTGLMKGIMKSNNVDNLEEMINKAIKGGVRIVACRMTMDLMGIKEEELIDGVECAGAAAFIEASEKSDTNLFIS